MARAKTQSPWMRRHLRDPYVKQAAAQGYRSRAAFKLAELDRRDKLIRPGMRIVDLGAAPGGWAQVAAQRAGAAGRVIAIDLQSIDVLPNVTVIRGDVREPAVQSLLDEALVGHPVDLVLSDMAPNLTGVKPVDEARSQELVSIAMTTARRVLKPGGTMLVKLFHGSGLDAVIRQLKAMFAEVGIRKPPASRSESSEIYAVCRRMLPPAAAGGARERLG
jgi:23S rRNA (uridine2552-2'-O)-methyltransferase